MRRLSLLCSAVLCGSVAWGQETDPRERTAEEQQRVQERLSVEMHERRQERTQRRASGPVRVFEDADGVPMLTNRPEKYENRPDLVEVEIDFNPIVVPDRLRQLSQRDRHGATDLKELVEHYAAQYNLEESLVYAIIRVESAFNQHAISSAGARGYMQLMPGTAEEMGVSDIFDPAQNIAGGTQYLALMLEHFDNDLRLALAAYNAGPGAVQRHGGIPPFQETRNYVRMVQQYADLYAENGFDGSEIAPARPGSRPSRTQLARSGGGGGQSGGASPYYTVHFRSGLTQPAEEIVETDSYYYIQFHGRTVPVRRDLVSSIDEPA